MARTQPVSTPPLPDGNVGDAITALMDAVAFLASYCERRPDWIKERDELLERVRFGAASGEISQNVYVYLEILVGAGRA